MLSIRPAVPDDAVAIGEVQVASWDAAYRGLVPDGAMNELTVANASKRWSKEMRDPDPPGSRSIVVEDDHGVRGFARFGPARDSDSIAEKTTGELYGFYLHPDAWGLGIGRSLMEAVLNDLRAAGLRHVTLNVVEGNARARAFYEHLGWISDRAAAPWFDAPQVRYRKEL